MLHAKVSMQVAKMCGFSLAGKQLLSFPKLAEGVVISNY